MTNNSIIPAHTPVIPAQAGIQEFMAIWPDFQAVIPASSTVMPAPSTVIPAQAGIQNVRKDLYSLTLSSNIFINGRNNSYGADVPEKSKAQR
jgi:hypothetical protein